jgi:hypothetical protein
MFYLIRKFFTAETITHYYFYYKGKSYIVIITKEMSLDIRVIHLVKDIEKTIYLSMKDDNAIAMTSENQFYIHTLQVIGDD